MDGFLTLTTGMGLGTERVVPADRVARIDTPAVATPHPAPGSCTVTMADGTTHECPGASAYSDVLKAIGALGILVA